MEYSNEEDRLVYANHREIVLGDHRIQDMLYLMVKGCPVEISGDHLTKCTSFRAWLSRKYLRQE